MSKGKYDLAIVAAWLLLFTGLGFAIGWAKGTYNTVQDCLEECECPLSSPAETFRDQKQQQP